MSITQKMDLFYAGLFLLFALWAAFKWDWSNLKEFAASVPNDFKDRPDVIKKRWHLHGLITLAISSFLFNFTFVHEYNLLTQLIICGASGFFIMFGYEMACAYHLKRKPDFSDARVGGLLAGFISALVLYFVPMSTTVSISISVGAVALVLFLVYVKKQ